MDLKRAVSLLAPFAVVSSMVGIMVIVLVYIGFPMAGVGSAAIATGLAAALTLSLAYFFSHTPPAAGGGHH